MNKRLTRMILETGKPIKGLVKAFDSTSNPTLQDFSFASGLVRGTLYVVLGKRFFGEPCTVYADPMLALEVIDAYLPET